MLVSGKEVSEGLHRYENVCVADDPFIIHDRDPDTLEWGQPDPSHYGHYNSVFIDGVEYFVSHYFAIQSAMFTIFSRQEIL